MAAQSLDGALYGLSSNLNNGVNDMMYSGKYYVTPELSREFRKLDVGVNQMKLDHELQRSSREWGSKFDPMTAVNQKQGAVQALNVANGTMNSLRSNLNSDKIRQSVDNQVRETHHNAVNTLRKTGENLAPFTTESVDHIRGFCDYIGVTDRYTGYRNNLNRGSRDPVKLGFNWMDQQNKNAYNNTLNVGYQAPRTPTQNAGIMGSRAAASAPAVSFQTQAPEQRVSPASARCIQERCGINTTFPGSTEYMQRYVSPQLDPLAKGYKINPAPNFHVHGRPVAKQLYSKGSTEYQTRYTFPDGSTLVKLPWVRV